MARLIALVADQCDVDPHHVDPDTPMPVLGFDSLDFLNFLLEVEAEFDVVLDYQEAKGCSTLRALGQLVDRAMVAPSLPTQNDGAAAAPPVGARLPESSS